MLPLLLGLVASSGCATRRLLTVENRLLQQENSTLTQQVQDLEKRTPSEELYDRHPDLETVHRFLDRAGYTHTWTPGASHISIDWAGNHTTFSVTIQLFASAGLVFISTNDYLHLDVASNTESLVMLLVQLAALNYELLIGKLQLNTETGEILLSMEIPTNDGLGYATLIQALEQLLHTADARYEDLRLAASGLGL